MRRCILIVSIFLCAGCASWYLRGAQMASAPPASAIARFNVSACANVAGQPVPGPQTTYYLSQEATGTVLYEIEGNGTGARITNSWSDANGQYFFVWVGNGPGWQYFFPQQPGQPPIRFAFDRGTYRGDHSTGVTRPIGAPSATCVMQRIG